MNKGGIRSFSLGILFAVSIIGAYYYFFDKQIPKQFDAGNAKALLQQKGYVILTANEYDKLSQKGMSSQPNKVKGPASQLKKSNAGQSNPTMETSYQLKVLPGMNPSEIAQLLYDHHVINNEKEFETFLTSHKLETKIRVGVYNLTNNMDDAQIADILTKGQ